MLKAHGGWMLLGNADEQKSAAGAPSKRARCRTRTPWAIVRSEEGLRGRFAMYVPPVLQAIVLAKVERQPRNNRMRAI